MATGKDRYEPTGIVTPDPTRLDGGSSSLQQALASLTPRGQRPCEQTVQGTTSIIVPCHNEAARLPIDAFRAVAVLSEAPRILFVDDGSTDGTAALIAPLVAEHPERFQLFRLEVNAGKAEAVRHGMLLALEDDPEIVGFWDADLSTPLTELPRFHRVLARRPSVQIVMGSRVRMLGRQIRRRPARHYLGRVGATLISWALHLAVYDTQCGAKLFRVTPAVRSIWAHPFNSGWLFDVEILFRFLHAYPPGDAREKMKEALYELPLAAWRDVGGSKVRAQHYALSLWDLYALWRYYRP
ncbi:MAG TPA: glycosyltransferase [Candidatus Methylomirabilis sp.]|nr:glycosyltransferase [Candidatus Methylomirabilis sp.]